MPRRLLLVTSLEAGAEKPDVYPSTLSGGQYQRLAIERALAMAPDCMLLDEAASAVDPEAVGEVLDTMRLPAGGVTTVLRVAREAGSAHDVSGRVACLDDGRIEEIGPPFRVFGTPQSGKTSRFLARAR